MAINLYSRRCAGQTRVLDLGNCPVLLHRHVSSNRSRHIAAAYAVDDVQSQAVQEGYNALQNSAYWQTRPVSILTRLIIIGSELARWRISTTISGSSSGPPLLLDSLCRLGPAFVKIGQALSSRPDIMPPAYQAELEKLQDRIPPFSNEDAMRVIEAELGRKVGDIFLSISSEPVAAASIGQVYKAVLRSNGKAVAVKVQRPGVVELIAKDVYILRYLAFVLRRVAKLNTDLPSLVDEWATSLFKVSCLVLTSYLVPEVCSTSHSRSLTTGGRGRMQKSSKQYSLVSLRSTSPLYTLISPPPGLSPWSGSRGRS